MKKLFAFILTLLMCLNLCACSRSSSCTVTFKDGTTQTLTVDEILDIRSDDEITWEKYANSEINGEGKITAIKKGSTGFAYITSATVKDGITYTYDYYTVEIDDFVEVLVRAETFEGITVGDNVRYNGRINSNNIGVCLQVDCENDPLDNPQPHIFLK